MKKEKITSNMTEEQKKKCHAIIHTASAAAGGVGAAGAQIPIADHLLIMPIQVSMIIGLGQVFHLKISESAANGLIKSTAASFVGRGVSQILFGWVPVAVNALNSATAASITEAVGWLAVKEFAEHGDRYEEKDELSPDEKKEMREKISAEYLRLKQRRLLQSYEEKEMMEKISAEYQRLKQRLLLQSYEEEEE